MCNFFQYLFKKKKIMHFCLLLQFKNNDFFFPKTHSITILMHRLATSLYLYITNKWSIVFNTTVLKLHHVSSHVIPIFFFLFVLQFENGFCKFQNYSNSCIINSSPIINLYNKSQPTSYLFTSTIKPNPKPF